MQSPPFHISDFHFSSEVVGGLWFLLVAGCAGFGWWCPVPVMDPETEAHDSGTRQNQSLNTKVSIPSCSLQLGIPGHHFEHVIPLGRT